MTIEVNEQEKPKRTRRPSRYLIYHSEASIEITEGIPNDIPESSQIFRVVKEICPTIQITKKEVKKDSLDTLREKDPDICYKDAGKWIIRKLSEGNPPFGINSYILAPKDVKKPKQWILKKSEYKYLAICRSDSEEEELFKYKVSSDSMFPDLQPDEIDSIYEVFGELVFASPDKGQRRKIEDEQYLFIENHGPVCYADIETESRKWKDKIIFALGNKVNFKVTL